MNRSSFSKVSAAALIALLPGAAFADTATIAPEIVVTGGTGPTPIEEVGASITVITAEDIARRQYRDVSQALQSIPGMHVVQSGGTGTISSAFTRGSNSNHTLVLLNGIEINDPSTPTGAFDFAHLSIDNVERIEVIRGPQSAIYGSAAIGGVVNIITKRGTGDLRTDVSLELGSLGTFNTNALVSGSQSSVDYALSISRRSTDGHDITPTALRGANPAEEDGNENVSLSARLDTELSDQISAFFFGEFTDTRTDLDNAGGEDLNASYQTEQLFLSAGLKGNYLDGAYRPALTLNYTDYDRLTSNNPDAAVPGTTTHDQNDGSRILARLENIVTYGAHTANLALEYREESLKTSGFRQFVTPPFAPFVQTLLSDKDESAYAVSLTDRVTFENGFFATASVRFDDPEEFGSELTYSVTPGFYHAATDTRITASYATGYRTPSLFERFGNVPNTFGGFVGNPNLKPETSKGWEIGLEQGLLDGSALVGATYFSTDFDDAILAGLTTTSNVDEFSVHGVETFIEYSPISDVNLRADYTFTVVDRDDVRAGQLGSLSRRPRHKLFATADWQPDADTTLGATVEWVDLYRDVNAQTGAQIEGDNYTVVNLAGSRKIGPSFTVFANVTNLLDREYQPANGFSAPGREFLTGVKLSF